MSTLYKISYLLSQALGVFAVYKLMKAFYDSRKVKRTIEIVSFVAYYLLTTSVYLSLNIPIINFSVNFLAAFSLSFLYRSSIKKKIFVSVLIYVFGFCTEMLAVTLTGYINFPISETNNYDSIYGAVAANVLLFIVSIVANGFKNIKNDSALPRSSWMSLLIVPVLSLFILAMLFGFEGLSAYDVSFSVAAILTINFTVFFLFDRVAKLYQEKQESALIKQQNEYYASQLQLSEELHAISGKLRHDIKNHLLAINSYLEENNIDGAKNHISDIIDTYKGNSEIVHTGHPAIDGLLNSKLQPAANSGIKINIKVSLPSDFRFSSFDLTIILGNLIDNALQAVSLVEENKFIDFKMDCSKGMVIIKISNPFKTALCRENGEIITSKSDKENHGFGLRSVNEILEKYNGTSKIDESDNIFTIMAAFYSE